MANMQIQSSNGTTVITSLGERKIVIRGKQYEIPEKVARAGSSATIVNGKIYINGYEFMEKEAEFKRTLTAFWHWWF